MTTPNIVPCPTRVVAVGAVTVGRGWGVADGTGVGVRGSICVGAVVVDGSGINDASALAVSTAQIAPIKSKAS
jgi:hypothetical protein